MNTHNPYTPPATPLADTAPPLVVMRKPISVWVLQIICALAALVILLAVPGSFDAWRAAPAGDLARFAMSFAMLLEMLVASLFLWTFVAAQRRSHFGRWLGVCMLGVLISILLFAFSNAEMLDRFLTWALVFTPLGLLVYFSAFSKGVRAWYGKSSSEAPS
jgi:hypothetical protein